MLPELKFHVHQLIPTDSRPNFPDFPTGSHDWITKPGLAGWLFHMDGITQLCLKIGFPVDQTIPSYWPKSWLSLRPHIRYTGYYRMGFPNDTAPDMLHCSSAVYRNLASEIRPRWDWDEILQRLWGTTKIGVSKKTYCTQNWCHFGRFDHVVSFFLVVFMWVSSDLADDMFQFQVSNRPSGCVNNFKPEPSLAEPTSGPHDVFHLSPQRLTVSSLMQERSQAWKTSAANLEVCAGRKDQRVDHPRVGTLSIWMGPKRENSASIIWCSPLHLHFEEWHMHLQTWLLTSTRMGSPRPMDQKAWLRWHGAARTFRGLLLI